jgi:hypothetical protein
MVQQNYFYNILPPIPTRYSVGKFIVAIREDVLEYGMLYIKLYALLCKFFPCD